MGECATMIVSRFGLALSVTNPFGSKVGIVQPNYIGSEAADIHGTDIMGQHSKILV